MPANPRDRVAERTLIAVRNDGSEQLITLALGRPYRATDGDWACPVALEGLYPPLGDLHGVDSWQALQLAYQFIERLVTAFVDDGGVLLWPEGRDPVHVSELFPGLGALPR